MTLGKTFPLAFVITPLRQRECDFPQQQCFFENPFSSSVEEGGGPQERFFKVNKGSVVLSLKSFQILS